MTRKPASRTTRNDGPLADALDKNKQATRSVEEAADELAVIHSVLEAETQDGSSHEVKQAVDQAQQVERRLDKSVEVLEEVNETLQREVDSREKKRG